VRLTCGFASDGLGSEPVSNPSLFGEPVRNSAGLGGAWGMKPPPVRMRSGRRLPCSVCTLWISRRVSSRPHLVSEGMPSTRIPDRRQLALNSWYSSRLGVPARRARSPRRATAGSGPARRRRSRPGNGCARAAVTWAEVGSTSQPAASAIIAARTPGASRRQAVLVTWPMAARVSRTASGSPSHGISRTLALTAGSVSTGSSLAVSTRVCVLRKVTGFWFISLAVSSPPPDSCLSRSWPVLASRGASSMKDSRRPLRA
jgi:hypothetical protein